MGGVYALDDIFVLQLLEQADFTNGSTRNSFIFGLEPDLLQGNDLICIGVASLVDHAVGTWCGHVQATWCC